MFDIPAFADLNLVVAAPAIFLALSTLVLLLVDLFLPEDRKHYTPIVTLVFIGISFVLSLLVFAPEDPIAFGGMFTGDSFTAVVNLIALGTAFVTVMLSTDYLQRTNIEHGEFYTLLLLSTAGVMFMAASTDLIMIFIALELLSIPLYVLAAFRSLDQKSKEHDAARKSEESGIKYFIMGAFASAFFVYGIAMIYGGTGTTNLVGIFEVVSEAFTNGTSATFLIVIGAALLVVGLGFKVALVPFHMWTPDVYEGSPTPITGYMSVAAKAGGFAALMRVLIVAFPALSFSITDGHAAWQATAWVLAAATLILGNVVALSQRNMKRMLAYSSIAHAGYVMMAISAAGTLGVENAAIQATLVYLVTYMVTNLGAFAVVLAIEKNDGTGTDIDDFKGLFKSRPGLASAMAVFMLSLTGIPLTAGFIGKWFVFSASLQAQLIPLAVIGAIVSVIGAFYYVRVIVYMFLEGGEDETDVQGDEAAGATRPVLWAIYATVAATLILGIVSPLLTNLIAQVSIVP